jgi:hypothetical protein
MVKGGKKERTKRIALSEYIYLCIIEKHEREQLPRKLTKS